MKYARKQQTYCYREEQRDTLISRAEILRAGGTDYFVYNKNDPFGGQEFISKFNGWFKYIRSINKADKNPGD